MLHFISFVGLALFTVFFLCWLVVKAPAWARVLIFIATVAVSIYAAYHAGRSDGQIQVSATYGRFVRVSYNRISGLLATGNTKEASRIASALDEKFYIAGAH